MIARDRIARAARRALVALGFAAVLGAHFSLTAYYLDSSHMGADEGFYAIAARSAMEGKIPYRDFAYTQMPLLPYLNGAAMEIAGYGITEQRAINIVWATLGLLGIVLALRQRLGSWEPGLVAAFAVAASPHWAEMMAIGTSHGSASGFAALAAAAVLFRRPARQRAVAFGALATIAVGCRLAVAPMALLLWPIPAIEARGLRERLFALGVPAGIAALGLLPFVLAAPEGFFYNVWTYHTASVFDRRSLAQAVEWWRLSPAGIVILLAGLCGIVELVRRRAWSAVLLLLAALVGVGAPMVPKSAYGCYATPAMLVAAAAGTTALWTADRARGNPFRHVAWVLPAMVLLHPLPRTLPWGTSTEVEALGAYIEAEVPPGPLLTPVPIVAVEAGRPVLPGTEMGMFAAMHPKERSRARRLRLTTIPDLVEAIERREPAAIVKMKGRSRWNFQWQNPTLRRQPNKAYGKLEKALARQYRTVERGRTMEVMVPR